MFTKAGGFCALLAVVPGGGEVEPYPSPSDTSPEERGEEAGIFFFFFFAASPVPAVQLRCRQKGARLLQGDLAAGCAVSQLRRGAKSVQKSRFPPSALYNPSG